MPPVGSLIKPILGGAAVGMLLFTALDFMHPPMIIPIQGYVIIYALSVVSTWLLSACMHYCVYNEWRWFP